MNGRIVKLLKTEAKRLHAEHYHEYQKQGISEHKLLRQIKRAYGALSRPDKEAVAKARRAVMG